MPFSGKCLPFPDRLGKLNLAECVRRDGNPRAGTIAGGFDANDKASASHSIFHRRGDVRVLRRRVDRVFVAADSLMVTESTIH